MLDGQFKGEQVRFPQFPFVDNGVEAVAVGFLVVQDKMLEGRDDVLVSHPRGLAPSV